MRTGTVDSSALRDKADGAVVLVVERDEPLRALVRRSLRPAGCFVLEAADGQEAAFRLSKSRVSIIVTDCSEPGIAGRDGVRDRLAPDAWILRITTREGQDLLDLAPEKRTFVLSRPFRADALADKVRELLATL